MIKGTNHYCWYYASSGLQILVQEVWVDLGDSNPCISQVLGQVSYIYPLQVHKQAKCHSLSTNEKLNDNIFLSSSLTHLTPCEGWALPISNDSELRAKQGMSPSEKILIWW